MTTDTSARARPWGTERADEIATLADAHSRRFPWYAGLADTRARASGRLDRLPVLDTELLVKHYYTADHPRLPDAEAYLTSGTSTGRRKRILYAPADEEDYVSHRRALFEKFVGEARPGATAVADLGTGHAAASARRIFLDMGFDARDIAFQLPLTQHVELLNAWRPDVLFTMPMILDRLMQPSHNLRIAPRKIMVVGDLAPENWRRLVARHFGIGYEDVLDVFGSIEIGAIAHWDAATHLYHFHDHVLPEVLAPGDLHGPGIPRGGGGDGALLLTSFARRYFPALRYVTGDLIKGLRTIRHEGRMVYAFDRIEGRLGGDLKHGERISQHDLCEAMAEVFPGAAFEAVNDGRLTIRVAAEVTDGHRSALRALLERAAPDVAQMIGSGLVGDIEVEAVAGDELVSGRAKRRLNLREV